MRIFSLHLVKWGVALIEDFGTRILGLELG